MMYVFHCMLATPFTPQQARRYFLQSQAENCCIGEWFIDGSSVKVTAHDLRACDNDPHAAMCRLRNILKRTGMRTDFTIYLEIASEHFPVVYSILAWTTAFAFPWLICWGNLSWVVWYDSQSLHSSGGNSSILEHAKAYLEQSDFDYQI